MSTPPRSKRQIKMTSHFCFREYDNAEVRLAGMYSFNIVLLLRQMKCPVDLSVCVSIKSAGVISTLIEVRNSSHAITDHFPTPNTCLNIYRSHVAPEIQLGLNIAMAVTNR